MSVVESDAEGVQRLIRTACVASCPPAKIIPHPMVEWTRGVTVRTTPERVWPWLVQMGYGRGGWYTPGWVDLFANRWVFAAKERFPAALSDCCPSTSTSLLAI
ncbi:MAG TPA: hypothetical protein VI094_11350 [Propionibacteriaceae bacterium]